MKLKLLSLMTTVSLSLSATANYSKAVNTNNLLNEKLANAIVETQDEAKNFMISGTSLSQALSILANGSAGHTKSELESYLETSIEELNSENKSLMKSLNFTAKQKKEAQARNKYSNPAIIATNNSIWRTSGLKNGPYRFNPEFIQAADEYYSAEHKVIDFVQADSADKMNEWANVKTNGLIKEIIDHDTVKDMLWVIMNATYLEASWAKRFYVLSANAPVFHGIDSEIKDVEMMSSNQYVGHLALEDSSELVSIKLNSDEANTDLAFVAYIPAVGKSFEQSQKDFFSVQMQKENFTKLASNNNLTKANITMPKFSFDYSVELEADKEITKALGLNNLFQNNTDLSLMGTQDSVRSKVSLIKQTTKVELDERGIKAAAVTIIGGVRTTSIDRTPTKTIVLDRPFMFAIVDRATQTVLFSGSLVDPSKK